MVRIHRKSRYAGLIDKIKEEFNETISEISTKRNRKKKRTFNFIDLFAGCGGLSLGIKQAGFEKLCDVEILPHAVKTLETNFPEAHHYNGDITEFKPKEIVGDKEVHLVVGGPPCQGFSVAGKRNIGDERNQMFKQFVRVVKETNPYFFVLENVPGILTLDKGSFKDEILKEFKKIGYDVSIRILEAADYGVPQLRTRAVFVGNRLGLTNPYPKKHCTPENYNTIDDAINDLENKSMGEIDNHIWSNHSDKFIERIKKVEPGESLYKTFADSYKRQREGHPSMAIKENHGGTHIHYKLNRCISAREMARLQSFPDDFFFEGTHKQAFVQIGNAVPPLMAKNIGLAIRYHLENSGLID